MHPTRPLLFLRGNLISQDFVRSTAPQQKFVIKISELQTLVSHAASTPQVGIYQPRLPAVLTERELTLFVRQWQWLQAHFRLQLL